MNHREDILAKTGLQFFGKISASTSHEIKNALAIINEDAGLLEDMMFMSDKGVAVDPARIKILAGKIKDQIRRADKIVKRMNSFSHSVDKPLADIDAGELLELVAAISGRFAYMRGVTLDVTVPATSGTITTNPFFLENLLWLCLDFSMGAAGQEKNIHLFAEGTEKSIRIRFTKLDNLRNIPTSAFPGEEERALLGALQAEITVEAKPGEVIIILPKQMVG